MKIIAGALAAALLICGSTAFAVQIDLSTWTCRKFQSTDTSNVSVILAWLDGYYRGVDDPPIIDTDKFSANAKKLGEYCAVHPDAGLITATDTLFKPKE
jgi:acid stress chaperone HdeB